MKTPEQMGMGQDTKRVLRNMITRGYSQPHGGFGVIAANVLLDGAMERQGQQFVADLFTGNGYETTIVSFADFALSQNFDAVAYTRRHAERKPAGHKGVVLLGRAAESGLFDDATLMQVPNLETLMFQDRGSFDALYTGMQTVREKVQAGDVTYAGLMESSDADVRLTGTAGFLNDALGGVSDRQGLSYENTTSHAEIPLMIVAPTTLHAAATRAQRWFSSTRWNYLYAAKVTGVDILHPQDEDLGIEERANATAIYHHTDQQMQDQGVEMLQGGIAKIK